MKVIILGQGKLGKEIYSQTNWDNLSRSKNNIEVTEFDLWKEKLLPYDTILNCIANTNTYSKDKTSHIITNYKFVIDLVSFCNEHNKKLVHISTDYVYVNSNERASEDEVPVSDNSWYSHTKLLADSYIEIMSKNYLICRLSHKDKPFSYESAWTDVKTNADYTDVISSLVIDLIKLDAKGLYNVGTEEKTIYELAKQTNPNVKQTLSPIHIPKNVTMDLSKMKNILGL
jgi:dTDP-4-dehydrorhamnose reductase